MILSSSWKKKKKKKSNFLYSEGTRLRIFQLLLFISIRSWTYHEGIHYCSAQCSLSNPLYLPLVAISLTLMVNVSHLPGRCEIKQYRPLLLI